MSRAWTSLEEILAARCDRIGGHLLFKGCCSFAGPYTSFKAAGKKNEKAHLRRLVLEASGKEKLGNHSSVICGIASCLAIEHLEWTRGGVRGWGILTQEQIAEIGAAGRRREELLTELRGLTNAALARKCGVSRERIAQLLRDKFGVARKAGSQVATGPKSKLVVGDEK